MDAIGLVTGAAGLTVQRAMLPWLIVGALGAAIAVGGAGLYGGYEIANARHAGQMLAQQQAQNQALEAKNQLLLQAQARADEIAGHFQAALDQLRVVNKTFNNEIRHEVEKTVYTDCKLPQTGAALLNQHIDAVNAAILGHSLKPAPSLAPVEAKP